MKSTTCLICSLLFVALLAKPSFGHTELAKALKAKHGLRSVTCYACHARKTDIPAADLPAFKLNKKAFRNNFGQEIAKLLKGKDVTKRIFDAKAAAKAARGTPNAAQAKAAADKVKAAVTEEFLEVLKEVEKIKSPAGPTYGELLENAQLPGVKPKPKP